MFFSVEELKKNYEKYSIMEVGNKEVVILKNDAEKVYISEPKLVNSVKFSYAWVYANTKSNNFLEENNKYYEEAFNEDSKYLYDSIIDICKDYMETTGDMISKEALINFILEDEDIYEDVVEVINKLYSTNEIYQTFENYIVYLVTSFNSK